MKLLIFLCVLFISDVRRNMKSGMELKAAIDQAVDQCIDRGGPLAETMRGHKAEVTKMLLEEYNEAFHIASEKEIAREEGREAGREEERINTEKEKQRADAEKFRADVMALKLKGKEISDIAEIMNASIEAVEKILSEI